MFTDSTKIRNVIYIYSKYGQVNGAKQTPIEDSETSYDHISTLFNRTNRDEYHGPKLRQMLKAWALEGMYVFPHYFHTSSSMLTFELGTHMALASVLTKVTTVVLSGTLISVSLRYLLLLLLSLFCGIVLNGIMFEFHMLARKNNS